MKKKVHLRNDKICISLDAEITCRDNQGMPFGVTENGEKQE